MFLKPIHWISLNVSRWGSKCWFHLQPEDTASLVYDETEERSEDIAAELAENIQQAVEGLQVNVWL